jgi:uncharacterized protein YecT (DUF1311 family)
MIPQSRFHGGTARFFAQLCLVLLSITAVWPANATADNLSDVRNADGQLNQVYQVLSHNLDESGRSNLKSMERAWVQFKERDFALYSRLATQAGHVDKVADYQSEGIGYQIAALSALGTSKPIGNREEDPRGRLVQTFREADQVLNNVYRQCLGELPQENVQLFKESEALWVAYRDLYTHFDTAIKRGRADEVVLRDLTMNRVIQLRRYFVVLVEKALPVDAPVSPANPAREPEKPDPSLPDVFRFAR